MWRISAFDSNAAMCVNAPPPPASPFYRPNCPVTHCEAIKSSHVMDARQRVTHTRTLDLVVIHSHTRTLKVVFVWSPPRDVCEDEVDGVYARSMDTN